jgi:hypothetical protein
MTCINAVTTYGTFSKTSLSNLSDKIVVTSFSGRSWSTRENHRPWASQLVNFITCDCESSAPFL